MSASLIDKTTRMLESEQEFWLVDSVSDGRVFQYVRVKNLDIRIPLAEIANMDEIKNNLKAKGHFEGRIYLKKNYLSWMLKTAKDSGHGKSFEGRRKSSNHAQLILNNLNRVPEKKENRFPPTQLPV